MIYLETLLLMQHVGQSWTRNLSFSFISSVGSPYTVKHNNREETGNYKTVIWVVGEFVDYVTFHVFTAALRIMNI